MFKTQYAKVVDSTYNPNTETKEMIGGIYKVKDIFFEDKKIGLYNKDKTYYWWFNFSDVLPATEEEYKAQFENKEIEELSLDCDAEAQINDLTEKVNELVRAVNKFSK